MLFFFKKKTKEKSFVSSKIILNIWFEMCINLSNHLNFKAIKFKKIIYWSKIAMKRIKVKV